MSLKNILKNTAKITALASLIGFTGCDKFLEPKNFENPKIWKKYFNETDLIWSAYMKEKISHNSINWLAYHEEVDRKNHGKLLGYIKLPDLDGDGKVGK